MKDRFYSHLYADSAKLTDFFTKDTKEDKYTRTSTRYLKKSSKNDIANDGKYICLELKEYATTTAINRIATNLYNQITTLCYEYKYSMKKLLIIGLGNYAIQADSLGKCIIDKLIASPKIAKLLPSVEAITGYPSYMLINAMAEQYKPSTIIVLDTLCASSVNRLASIIQITNCGIRPGSGAGNPQPILCYESLSCPVITIGIPLVIASNTLGTEQPNILFTPVNIIDILDKISTIVASAINQT